MRERQSERDELIAKLPAALRAAATASWRNTAVEVGCQTPTMSRFFIPHVEDPTLAESTWDAARKFSGEQTGKAVFPDRIFRLEYTHNTDLWEAEVGKPHRYLPDDDWVVCILKAESELYLVCGNSRGVVQGEPILVGGGSVITVEPFDS